MILSQYSQKIFARQKASFPAMVAQLEHLAQSPDPRKTQFIALAGIVAHSLRNELTIIGVVLEIEALQGPDKVDCTVLPG